MESNIPPTVLDYNQTDTDEADTASPIPDAVVADIDEEGSVIDVYRANNAIIGITMSATTENITDKTEKAGGLGLYDNLTWDQCDYESEGVVIGVFGVNWKSLPVLKRRTICSKLKV
jgi:hypothetical protein